MSKSSNISKGSSNPIVALWYEFIVYLILGAIALAPYFSYLFLDFDPVTNNVFIKCNILFLGIFYVLSSLAFGLILEEIGSHIEVWCDKRLSKNNITLEKDWFDYLALQYHNNPPIAHGYIKTLVVRLKFKLCLIPAIIIFYIGTNSFNYDWYYQYINYWYVDSVSIVLLFFTCYWTYDFSNTLAELRKELLKRIPKKSDRVRLRQ